jgi:hypothetical protein
LYLGAIGVRFFSVILAISSPVIMFPTWRYDG